jgi:hypothetical protein
MGTATAALDMQDGFHPFWFWNDLITADEVRRQIASMAQQGIAGFFIHPRQGLEQPYLSAAFLDLVELAIGEGRAHGMAVHLYDEYPYPSGAAGGAVVQSDPGLAATTLTVRRQRLVGGSFRIELPAGSVVACTAFPIQVGAIQWERPIDLRDSTGMLLTRQSYYEAGPEPYNDRRFFADRPAPVVAATLPAGDYELVAVIQVPVSHHKYWGAFPDMANGRAVARFIELTHERYRARLGPGLPGVASIFTDEVEPGPSAAVLDDLERRHATGLRDLLIAFVSEAHPAHLRAVREMERAKLAVFEASFEAPISSWCHRNGIRYLGEKPSLRLSQLAWMDVPGCEPGHTKAGAQRHDLLQADIRGNARATASAAYFYGKEGSLCECFHNLGWGGTLQDAKLIAESLLVMGIRYLVPHALFYSTRGLRKHDAPPSFFQMPYWRLFGNLARRIGAIARELDGTWIDATVGLVEPHGGLPDAQQLACYEELQHRLMASNIDFLTVDADVLEAGSVQRGCVTVRDVALQAVVVPPMRDPEPGLVSWLERFERDGGLVARTGGPETINDIISSVTERCPVLLELDAVTGSCDSVLVTCRTDGKQRRWLLVNTAARPVELRLRADGLHLAGLAIDFAGPPRLHADRGSFLLRLEAFESALVKGVPADGATAVESALPPVLKIPASGRWNMRLLSPNLLRLGKWQISLPGFGSENGVVIPAPIANQLRASGLRFAPAISNDFGESPSVALPRMCVRYETSFTCEVETALKVLMEPGAIAGDWCLWIDGHGPYRATDFLPGPGPVDGCVELEIPSDAPTERSTDVAALRHLVVEVQVTETEHGLRDCLYIAGHFAVAAAATSDPAMPASATSHPTSTSCQVPLLATLRELPERGEIGAWEKSGLPFYAGAVEYRNAVTLSCPPDAHEVAAELALPEGCEDSAEISFGTGPFHPVPWSPRRVVVPVPELDSGARKQPVCVRISTTLAGAFEGRRFDVSRHAYCDVVPTQLED